MSRKYTLLLLGPDAASKRDELLVVLDQRLDTLGLSVAQHIDVRDRTNTSSTDINSESLDFPVAVWFGAQDQPVDQQDLDLLNHLLGQKQAIPVYPVCDTLHNFRQSFPSELHPINGLAWDSSRVAGELLGAFELTRRERQVFLSYLRSDSTAIATQLYSALQLRGFQVFLDSASVKPGKQFQDVLMGRLGDVDLLIVLDSPGFTADSEWTYKEVVHAKAKSIGGLRLIWPTQRRDGRFSDYGWDEAFSIFESEALERADFCVPRPRKKLLSPMSQWTLKPSTIDRILSRVEDVRIRALGERRNRLLQKIRLSATSLNLTCNIVPYGDYAGGDAGDSKYGYMEVTLSAGAIARIYPIIGFPDAWLYESRHRGSASHSSQIVRSCIAYDDLLGTPELEQHLQWLSAMVPTLPLRSVNHIEAWLQDPIP